MFVPGAVAKGQGIGEIEFLVPEVHGARSAVFPKFTFACTHRCGAIEAQFHVALEDDVQYRTSALCIKTRPWLADHLNAVDVGRGHVFQQALHVHVLGGATVDEDGQSGLTGQTDAVIDHNHTWHLAQYIQRTTTGPSDAVGHIDNKRSGFLFQKWLAGRYFCRGKGLSPVAQRNDGELEVFLKIRNVLVLLFKSQHDYP